MSWITHIARPDIQALRPYQHAHWQEGTLRLHANEMPWRNPADTSLAGLNRYPEPHPLALGARLADFYGVASSSLLVGRGSDELIDLLIRAYCAARNNDILIFPPTFGMYAVAAQVQGAGIESLPVSSDHGFAPDLAAAGALISARRERPLRLIFICSPNNPTGNVVDADHILKLVRSVEGHALVIVDEAYAEFSPAPSLLTAVADHPGLVILRTLSKVGLAGARCGSLIAHPEIVELLRRVIQPYALPQPTIEAVTRTLEPTGVREMRRQVSTIVAERRRMAAALAALPAVRHVWPSAANFLLVDFVDADAALSAAAAGSILLRDFRHATGLTNSIRITIGTSDQNDQLLAVLARIA